METQEVRDLFKKYLIESGVSQIFILKKIQEMYGVDLKPDILSRWKLGTREIEEDVEAALEQYITSHSS